MESSSQPVRIRRVLAFFFNYIRRHLGWTALAVAASVAATLCELVAPLAFAHFIDLVRVGDASPADSFSIARRALFMVAGALVAAWTMWRIAQPSEIFSSARIMRDMELDAFAALLRHSYQYFSDTFAGSLTRRISRLVQAYSTFADILIYHLIGVAVTFFGILGVVWVKNTLLFWTLITWALIYISMSVGIALVTYRYDVKRAAADSEAGGYLADSIANVVTIKLFSSSAFEAGAFSGKLDHLTRWRIITWMIDHGVSAVQGILMILMQVGLLYAALVLWRDGRISLGEIVLVQTYGVMLANWLWGLGRTMRRLYELFAEASEGIEIFDTPLGVADPRMPSSLKVHAGAVAFDDVTFSYHKTRTVLSSFSLTIGGGEKVALVGPSGSGKSTVTKLLLRFYDLDHGSISIDGQNIARVRQDDLREQVALVPQDPILFHRSLMENIRYGRRDATDDEVKEAARQAHCHEFISMLPDGYDTLVGERGVKLSGGERQRVAIARAILKNAPILVLDEATSALDSESEHLIQEALETLMQGKTVMVIAHRLSTIQKMDRIIVMEGGQVVDQGTHEALLSRDGLYRTLWSIQAGGFFGEEAVAQKEEARWGGEGE